MYHDLQVMIHEDGGACIPFFIIPPGRKSRWGVPSPAMAVEMPGITAIYSLACTSALLSNFGPLTQEGLRP